MNIVVNDKCSNHCPYCFASTEMGKQVKHNQLSRSNIAKIQKIISNGKPNFDVNIIGGEPFIYKDLEFLIESLISEKNINQITIFTGGIFPKNSLTKLQKYSQRVYILFNINEKKDYINSKEYETVLNNLSNAIEYGFQTNIGYNIYYKEFNYIEIIKLCLNFGIENLRWSVASPQLIPSENVKTIKFEDYKLISQRCFDFLEYSYHNEINSYLDCPLPKCFFSNLQLGRLSQIQPQVVSNLNKCNPVIDVNPDLSVFRCFSLSEIERVKLMDFEKFNDIEKWFEQNFDDLFGYSTLYEDCINCEFSKNRTCFGGCIANSPNSINKGIKISVLTEQVFSYLQSNELEKAEQTLNKIVKKDAITAFLYAHLYLQKEEFESAKSWAYKTILRSTTPDLKIKANEIIQNIKQKIKNGN